MPTKRRRTSRALQEPVSPALRYWFNTGEEPPEGSPDYVGWQHFYFFMRDEDIRARWGAVRDEFVAAWVTDNPGSRPFAWWKYDGPGPRRRVSGSGTETVVVHAFGEPSFYDVDPVDPPAIESEAAFLDRHGLFLPGERRRVEPDAFVPVEGIWYAEHDLDVDDESGADVDGLDEPA